MNSKHSQFGSDNKRDLEVLGLIEELTDEEQFLIVGGISTGAATLELLKSIAKDALREGVIQVVRDGVTYIGKRLSPTPTPSPTPSPTPQPLL
ncbi:hypothetical protein [Nostoc sp.]|uniref:hypothetical protein n=1 Tax=Nostoc sp. TaxID=1180 RepID=UPI002FF75C13